MALGPFAAQNHWDVRNTELARGFEAQMAVDHIAVTSNQTRNLETKFSDSTAHEVHGCIVLAPVAQYRTNLSMGQICIFIGSSLPDCEERRVPRSARQTVQGGALPQYHNGYRTRSLLRLTNWTCHSTVNGASGFNRD